MVEGMDKVPSLSDLEYLLAVVSEGSFTKASRRLRVQQSTLTLAVQRVESIVGHTLLVRTRSGTTPTRHGRVLMGKAQRLLESWKDVVKDDEQNEPLFAARFSIGCHQSIGRYLLKRFMPQLLQKFPGIEITVQHDYTSSIVDSVLSFRTDFGFAVNPTPHRDLAMIRLYQTYLGLWGSSLMSKDHENVLFYDPKMYAIEHLLERASKEKRFSRLNAIGSLDTIATLVDSGAGYGIMPADTACSLGPSRLKLVWEAKGLPELTVSFFYRKDAQRSKAAEAVIKNITGGLVGTQPGKFYRPH